MANITIDQLTKFKEKNESFELSTYNFFDQDEQLAGLEEEGGITEEHLKGLQRLTDITQNETHALNLYNKGLDSCFQVGALSKQQFIDRYQAAFGGSSSLAAATHERALARQSQLIHHYLNIKAHHEPHYKALHAHNLTAATEDNYSNLPSYQDLFGGLNYCEVEECRTIFSPAAYLLDLIRFKEKQIDDSNVGTDGKLANRRPDLNAIPLDCENTDTAIPKLEIVNKVLVNKVKLDNKATQTEDQVYQALTQKEYPFNLPFHLPLTQIRAYLDILKTDLPTIWGTLDINASSVHPIARETLAISLQEFTLYTTSKTAQSDIQAAYGLGTIDPLDQEKGLANIDVFLAKTGLSREALDQLLFGDLSEAEINAKLNEQFFINIKDINETKAAIAIDSDGNQLTHLTLSRLDRIHRFIRLAHKINWSFVDLNWVLQSQGLQPDGTYQPTEMDDAMIHLLAQLVTWQKTYPQPIHVLSTLVGNIKDFGKAHGKSFFEEIFLQLDTSIPLPDEKTEWNIKGEDAPDLHIQSILTGALGISPEALQGIATKVRDIMHAGQDKLPLGLSELSALYRLTLVAKWLTRPTETVMELLHWMSPQDDQYTKALIGDSTAGVQTQKVIEALDKLIALSQTLQTGSVSKEALTCILGDPIPIDSPYYLSPDSQINFINTLYQAIQPTLITPSTLQANEDLPQVDRAGNPFDFHAALKDWGVIDDKGIILKILTEAELQAKLAPDFHASAEQLATIIHLLLVRYEQLQATTLAHHLNSQFAVAQNTVPEIEHWASFSLDTSENWLQLLWHSPSDSDADKLPAKATEALQTLNRYSCLAKILSLTKPELQSIIAHPACYNIHDINQLTIQDIAYLAQYKQLVNTYQDKDHHLVAYFAQASQSAIDIDTAAKALAKLMQIQEAPLKTLLEYWWPSDDNTPPAYGTVAGLMHIKQCFELSQQLGLSIASLLAVYALAAQNGTTDADYQAFANAANRLLGTVKAQYHDTAWTAVYEPIQVTLNEAKRDALADLVIYQGQQQGLPISTHRDLYEYLLIDVDVSGVFKTSVIKEAIGCLQLYVNRCRMNLEQDITFPDREDLERNWAWIHSYRVWEANRKIFLYPEDYIQPELRQEKTDLFQHLIESLQQTHIDQASVSQAANGYLDRFAEVANLKYAGSYARGMKKVYTLQAPNPQKYAYFGAAISLSSDGTRALIGAQGAGEAYVYTYQGDAWTLQHTLQAPQQTDYFGAAVSLSSDGTRALVGAYKEVTPSFGAGRAYVYAYQADTWTWTLQQALQAPNPQEADQFGWAVSLSSDGTRALVGANFKTVAGVQGAGAAYVYAYQGGAWTLAGTLQAPIPQDRASFGNAVSLNSDGTRALVGAYREDVDGYSNAGRAYVYAYQGGAWTLQHTWQAPTLQAYTSFGAAVSLNSDGTRALVGAVGENAAYAYAYQGGAWTLAGTLQAPNPQAGARFGTAVSLSSDGIRALVGENAAYAYVYQEGAWILQGTWQAPNSQAGARFGTAVSLSSDGTRVLVGAPTESVDEASDAGRAYYFSWWPESSANPDLVLLNRTSTKPYQYYYRQADFIYDTKKHAYTPTDWSPWTQINLTIPAKFASPIYAFGKLFVFWAEIKPAPSERKDADSGSDAGKVTEKRFTATICYSFYQFNKDWVAPQTVDEVTLPKKEDVGPEIEPSEEIKVLDTEDIVWQRVYVALQGSQIIVRYPKVVKEVNKEKEIRESYQWSIGIDLRSVSIEGGGDGYQPTLPLPDYAFDNLPADTVNYPVSNSDLLSILDTGHSAYLGILQGDGYILLHEDMQKAPSGELIENATYIQGEYVQLTDNTKNTVGNALEYTLNLGDSFVVDFEFWIGGSKSARGADALYFYAFAQSTPLYDTDRVTKGYIINYNEYLQYIGIRYAADPLDPQHMAKVRYMVPTDKKLNSSTWRKTRIIFNQGTFEILLDGTSILQYTDTDYAKRDLSGKRWGFGAWSGGATDYHRIRAIDVRVPTTAYIRLNSTTIHTLSQSLFAQGVDGLFSIATQLTPEDSFTALGPQKGYVATPYPAETLDLEGANGLYYWELFFHTPFLVANQFNTHQQFELAQAWYQYLYNPTIDQNQQDPDASASQEDHYWRFVGLRPNHNPTLKQELQRSPSEEIKAELTNTSQLAQYHEDPFEPHAIAHLRPIAYQKTLVMHYVDNLLDWGDDLFRQDTRETLVEATMHYVTAYDLLGKKPADLGKCALPAVQTLGDIREHYGKGNIPEFLIELENHLRMLPLLTGAQDNPNNAIPNIYFGIPENEQLIAYWDRVQGRLYNIRHNLTLDGQPNYLPLFQPPINPAQLIQAVAAGAGVSSAVAAMQVPVPYYRFTVMLEKAKNATNFVIQLGGALLRALEQRDAEELALLRTTHEQALLAMNRTIKQDQYQAAQDTVAALTKGQAGAQARLDHYSALLKKGLSAGEIAQFILEAEALYLQLAAQRIQGITIAGYLLPTVFGFADGDFRPGDAINAGSQIASGLGSMLTQSGGLAATVAQYQRRAEDWTLQKMLAQEDVEQIENQIKAAELQVLIADQELQVLEQNITQTQAIAQFLKTKFSDQEQYLWMMGQLSALYFQAYQLAHELTLAAQQAWQFENAHEHNVIQPGYWDNLHKGLLAGEALMLGLMHMEKAYMGQNVRYLEIVKTISLGLLDPKALSDLKANGSCTFTLDEKLFDLDYPGHYSRQIKTLSLSFPAVLGPYQNIHATLTQTGSKTVLKPDANTIKSLLPSNGDIKITPAPGALRTDGRANQQIALSQGVNDSGLFELRFEDARYLPFEGTGAVSSWELDILKEANQDVLASLTDVIITLRYTALAGDQDLKNTIKSIVYPASPSKNTA